jgi:hypothetical protein
MTVVPITEAELISIIGSLKNKNSSGYNEVSNKILRLCCHLVSQPIIIFLINHFLWLFFLIDLSMIKPLFKNGDKYNLANYRPILLLTAFAKLFEILVFHRVSQHFQFHNIFILKNLDLEKDFLSTIDATYKLTDSILQAWNDKANI